MHSIFPLVGFRSPLEIWQSEPSFLVGELLFHFLFTFLLVEVFLFSPSSSSSSTKSEPKGSPNSRKKKGHERVSVTPTRRYAIATLLGAGIGGGAIELLTILEPQIGNFYHSQSMVQLGGYREPLYMLAGCYTWIPAMGVFLAKRTGYGLVGQSCLAGLVTSGLWTVLDTVGLRYLWWTWHTSDPLYLDRILGVPAASGFWILASGCSLSLLLNLAERYGAFEKTRSLLSAAMTGAVLGPLAWVVVMQVPFTLFYHPIVTFGGYSAVWALHALRAICILTLFGVTRQQDMTWSFGSLRSSVACQLTFFFLVMTLIPFYFNPATVVRTSFGQPLGPCDVEESSFWGAFNRSKYVCPHQIDSSRDHFSLPATPLYPRDTTWYTLNGVPHPPFWLKETLFQIIFAFTLSLFALTITLRPQSSSDSKKVQ